MEEFRKRWRLVCDGIVIDDARSEPAQLLVYFRDHILDALTDPTWKFDGKMVAKDWVDFQERRLGVKLSTNLSIQPPGADLPVCSYLVKQYHAEQAKREAKYWG